MLKALRTYVNRSKRKTIDKRAFAKTATLEIANANGLDLPEDLKTAIESLDDELTEPKVVTVTGNYNDIHDNGGVERFQVDGYVGTLFHRAAKLELLPKIAHPFLFFLKIKPNFAS